MTKYVYMFAEGNATMRDLLGGKGANLAEMSQLGLPVPRGFTVTTEACNRYYKDGTKIAPEVEQQILDALAKEEEMTGKTFGDPTKPLLVSVRSGARASMPGMMDTILNLGLNDDVVKGLAELTGNPRFAYDSYRRFIMMFSDVVMEIGKELYEEEMDKIKERVGAELDTDLNEEHMKEVADVFLATYKKHKGEAFPQDPKTQLMLAIEAVFRSWNNRRAVYYRRMHGIPGSWGTAVNVQEMVYGNMGDTSGTGVAFSRNPATGENKLYGEYLMNAQGEDVVAGVRTPEPIDHLKTLMPNVYQEFHDIAERLEKHYGDMQDLEFTIENGKLFILQTRSGKRTATAALRVAVDMVEAGMLTKEQALLKIDPAQLDALLHPTFNPEALERATPLTKGLPASPGAAAGMVTFSAEEAYEESLKGHAVILARTETSPEDIQGMNVSAGILTSRGGMTSHAAVVARGMGKCCVSAAANTSINEKTKTMTINGTVIKSGEWISLDGSTGAVYQGQIETQKAALSDEFRKIMEWSDEFRTMKIRTNADTPQDATTARTLGAEGIGLTRTEHMFFEADRIFAFRQMIVARDVKAREKALAKILPMQEEDFKGIFEAMKGLPVTIRLLDPPLHEFLPQDPAQVKELATELNMAEADLQTIINDLHELNPMLGHRGLRLAISYPEIARMQTEGIIRAALAVTTDEYPVIPEIMIPLVAEEKEIAFVRDVIVKKADEIIAASGKKLDYMVGTMIEIPRACLTADEIAKHAEFFSFGTNDLTQMTYGLSRDDAGPILETYYNEGIFENDPTATLDKTGVGKLMEIGCELGRKTRPDMKIGICGEHGGAPSSIEFCNYLNMSYVSCSPFRVPIAKLSAAQAALKQKK